MTNDFVSLFKDTSTAYAISVWELATAYRELANARDNSYAGSRGVVVLPGDESAMAHLARRLERKIAETRSDRSSRG